MMAITEVCQFELKEEVDKMMAARPGRSLSSCIQEMVKFYASAGIEVKESTAKSKYHRASKTVANATIPVSCRCDNEIQEIQEHGGARNGAGRPIKNTKEEVMQNVDEDSDAFYQLKRWWKRATKKDRKKFMSWVKETK